MDFCGVDGRRDMTREIPISTLFDVEMEQYSLERNDRSMLLLLSACPSQGESGGSSRRVTAVLVVFSLATVMAG